MKFDIVLPTLFRDSLVKSVESVINQTHKNWNLYIVLDMPSDERINEVFKIIPEDDRITLLAGKKFPTNDFGASKRNYAINRDSDAEWIAYIDDDDIWLNTHLETLAKISKNKDMIRTAGRSFFMKHKSPRSKEKIMKLGPVNNEDILTVGMAHTREIFEKTSGWQPFDNHDHFLWKEMINAGGRAMISTEVTFLFKR